MDDEELRQLEDPASWDFDRAEERAPVEGPQAVVSVAFRREDYARVAELARRSNMRTTEYIREAALGRIPSRPTVAGVPATSSGDGPP